MNALDYVMLDEQEEEPEVAGRRRGDGDRTGPIRMSRPAAEDGDMEQEPEDTRDMLWQFLRGQNQILDKNFEHQTVAIDNCTKAVDAVGDKIGERLEEGLKAQAAARIEEAKIAAHQRATEQKFAAALGALLIFGLLVLAGATINGKYGDASVSAGHSNP